MAEARVVGGVPQTAGPLDLVHCPPRVPHTILGAGDGPALVLAVGARKEKGSARYPVEPAAVRHGAGVTSEGEEPYARFSEPQPGPPPAGL